jgi:fructose-1,6-bisphosphatase-3
MPSDSDLPVLRALSDQFHNVDAALAEIARLSAVLTLPKGTVHVISDIHGEDKKLRHVINNASGTLRPLVEKRFAGRMSPEELKEFLTLVFYPNEVTDRLTASLTPAELRAYAIKMLLRQFELVRVLASRYSFRRARAVFPTEYEDLFQEMFHAPTPERGEQFVQAAVNELARRNKALHLVHITGRLIRNLAIYELVIGGDCWDRGPRGDRVVDYIRQQPNVSFIWGNHDAAWLGASLGHEALMCCILRVSLRYRRISQLDEGYSIPLTPLEHLARTIYADDPATYFMPRENGLRPNEVVARMQKAAAIMQFKLEGQMIARHPEWNMDHRRLLHRIDFAKGTVEIDGKVHTLRDALFPTIDPKDPYKLSPEEQACIGRMKRSFLESQKLSEHMCYLAGIGAMYIKRDDHLIFHGCVAVDAGGEFLPMPINGELLAGREQFDEIDRVILRAIEERRSDDLDVLWYLWSGPRSPLFGKDRIATFERDFIADKKTHEETRNPYFALIHEKWFCDKVLAAFGVNAARGLIVNGHVPVKIEKGESPMKRSGKAITIDGAFSEAYGDHGYTLVLEADRTLLALHHHFESVESAIRDGVDIVPQVTTVREWSEPHRMGDTERGQEMRRQIELLERLVEAYQSNRLRTRT